MARTDALVLGAGIVGTCIALHLARRGLAVALVDRRAPGEETSFGNAGIIEGNTIFPPPFPNSVAALVWIALKRASEANYHLSFLPRVAPWLMAYRANSTPARLVATAHAMRPLFSQAVAEHEALIAEAGAQRYLRRAGWLKLYRGNASFAAQARELELAREFGIDNRVLDTEAARELEPALNPVFRHAVHWTGAVSITDPLALTRALVARFVDLGGVVIEGNALSLHRAAGRWRVEAREGHVDAHAAVVALGPWAPDLLERQGLRLPLAAKRGYHRHFRPAGNARLSRPVLDCDVGYCLAPMTQGIRLTTGAEFAHRDAAPTPVQFDRLMPAATELVALGERVETEPWIGSRPCFADSRPVIARAPNHSDLWLAIGHAHWGLTLGPATGRLVAEMMTGATPFCDPTPYGVERFLSP
ncbi:MAG: FAD-binding oxidoreductase [Proteobacteria bacterium]|nr:FAD-binding oxidoreductase [Pseudomonadota bacterium]